MYEKVSIPDLAFSCLASTHILQQSQNQKNKVNWKIIMVKQLILDTRLFRRQNVCDVATKNDEVNVDPIGDIF